MQLHYKQLKYGIIYVPLHIRDKLNSMFTHPRNIEITLSKMIGISTDLHEDATGTKEHLIQRLQGTVTFLH